MRATVPSHAKQDDALVVASSEPQTHSPMTHAIVLPGGGP